MNNEFGLINLWTEGDAVTRFVALVLLAMSLASWIVIILKTLNLLAAQKQAQRIEAFWHSANVAGGLQALGDEADNPFRALALRGEEAKAHLKSGGTQPELLKQLDESDWITRSLQNAIDDATAKLQSGLAILASVGSTSPFVGLLGTVWGIYHALTGIAASGQVGIEQVAGPVGEALAMTAAGLAVAIPAVLAYNVLGRRIGRIEADLEGFAHDLRALVAHEGAHAPATRSAP